MTVYNSAYTLSKILKNVYIYQKNVYYDIQWHFYKMYAPKYLHPRNKLFNTQKRL